MFAELQALEIKEIPPDLYNGIKLLLVVQGEVSARVSQESYVLRQNDMLLVNRYEMHSITGAPGNAVLQLCIPFEYLQQEGQELLAYAFFSRPGAEASAQAGDELRQLLYFMLIVQHGRREGYELELRANLFRLLHLLLQHFKLRPAELRRLTDCADPNIRAVVSAIHEQYRGPLTLEQMAKRQFLSKHYLSRLFKEQTGLGFLEYLTRVRLESARKDLLYTEDSVIQIALRNGFPSAQALSAHFKGQYGATPTDFRSGYEKAPAAPAQVRCRSIPFEQLSGIAELTKHLGGYEQGGAPAAADVEICSNAPTEPFALCERVIKVEKIGDLQREELRRQLVQAQEKIKFQYIHCRGVFFDGTEQYAADSMYWGYPYTRLFALLEQLELCPIFRLDIGRLAAAGITPEQAETALGAFLSLTAKNFPGYSTKRCMYELFAPPSLPQEDWLRYYGRLYKRLKKHSAQIKAGIALDWSGKGGAELCTEVLAQTVQSACPPDFITFCANPNPGYREIESERTAAQFLQGFYAQRAKELKGAATAIGLNDLPLFLLEWNTLVGENLLECASFFRAALVVEALLQFANVGITPAFWLSEHISEAAIGVDSGVLSLYHCMDLKRSLFYLLQLLSKLGPQLLFCGDGLLATVDSRGRYALLGYNPCYFVPTHAMDFDFVKRRHRALDVLLSGIPGGNYQIKAFDLAMNFSYAVNDRESIHRLPHVNVQHYYSDPDTLDYLAVIAAPQYALFQEHIEGQCTLHFDLPFNALKLYLIDRL